LENRNVEVIIKLSENECKFIKEIAQQVQLPLADLIMLAIIALDKKTNSANRIKDTTL
jgi:hypothetical protein